MFQHPKTKLLGVGLALCLPLLPGQGLANATTPDTTQTHTQTKPTPTWEHPISFHELRRETQTKIYDARAWAKNHQVTRDTKYFIDDMENATDRLQNQVSPVGKSIKSFTTRHLPGKSLLYKSEKSFTVFGLLLIFALAFVYLMMSLANPESRLGGRH